MLRDQLGPRLIEEAGANFDAPILRPFSSKGEDAVSEEAGRDRKPAARTAGAAGRRPPREEAGGLIRNRKPGRDERRESALSRLSTKAPQGDRPRGGKPFGDKPRAGETASGKREEAPRRSRTSNVWMAPGARPQGTRKPDDGEEKIVRVPRKPGDRKALHDAAAKRSRLGRAERAAAKATGEAPRREWQPRPEREERPKRDFKPRGEAATRPARDWKAKPPRPGKAERSAAKETGEAPQREYRPRPKREADDAGRSQDHKPWKAATSKTSSPRSRGEGKGEGQRGDFRKGRPAGDRPSGARSPSSPAGPSQHERGEGGKPPRPRKSDGRPSGGRPSGPRKGPGKPRGRG
jgi:23S rRNA pseudouridine2605 synthase